MNVKRILAKVILGVLAGAVCGVLLLGLFGLLVGGWVGLLNGATWGFFLGIAGGVMAAGIVEWSYWSAFMTRLGRSLQRRR